MFVKRNEKGIILDYDEISFRTQNFESNKGNELEFENLINDVFDSTNKY